MHQGRFSIHLSVYKVVLMSLNASVVTDWLLPADKAIDLLMSRTQLILKKSGQTMRSDPVLKNNQFAGEYRAIRTHRGTEDQWRDYLKLETECDFGTFSKSCHDQNKDNQTCGSVSA